MSDFDVDWGMEHDLHVEHDGGLDHALIDQHFDHHHELFEGTHGASDITDAHFFGDVDHDVHQAHDEPLPAEDAELPEWQLDPDFTDGHYDLVGADPHEDDMWSQFMTDMHEEINPYAAN